MIYLIACIRDAKTEAYSAPMSFLTRGAAVRSFGDEAVREGSEISKHPEDYALFHVGHFDDTTGRLAPLEQPVQIAHALDGLPEKGV